MTQYGYGYGYQPYGYGQAAANYMSAYQQQLPYAGAAQKTQQQQAHQAPQQQQQPSTATAHQQQPSVGYSPYTATQQHQQSSQQQHQQQQHAPPQQAARPVAVGQSHQQHQQHQQQQQYHSQQQQQAQAQQHQQQPQAQQPPPPGTGQVSASASYYTAAQQSAQAQAQQQQQQQAQAQQAAAAAYYGYSAAAAAAYRPQATSYASTATQQYYNQQGQRSQGQQQQQQSATATTAVAGGVRSTGTTGTGSQYGELKKVTTTTASSMVTYPAYTPTNYYSAYSKQASQKAGAQATAQALTSQQQSVVASYIQQKTAGAQQNFFTKRPPVNPQQYYCEVCRISCACAATYKTHLEGKNHKKRLQQQQNVPKESKSGDNYCELCDVVCSNKDAFEAHVRGSKHQKVLSLHRRLGKPIPQMNAAGTTSTAGGKTVMVTAPRITFIGGKQLHSTGQTGSDGNPQQEVKVYPPGAAVVAATPPKPQPLVQPKPVTPTVSTTPTAVGGQANATPTQLMTPTQATPTGEDAEVEPVGEQFVVSVKGDTKVPHATYKCELCDCYFNDDYAKKMHVKGRRHRLNYKKTYQPDLYIEPTKAQKKEIEKKRMKRVARRSTDGYSGPHPQQQGGGVGGNFGGGGGGGGAQGHASLNELRRQEALELAKRRQQMMSEDFSHGGPGGGGGAGGGGGGGGGPPQHYAQDGPPPPPPPPMYRDEGPGWAQQFGPPMPAYYPPAPPRPHNPHDDKLVLNKHSSIYPVESELKGVEAVVGDTEKALKQLSNDLLTEKCKLANPEATEVKKDEKLRELKGAYRVGTHAIGLLLRGECSVELVLMCANKPTHQLFNEVATRLPEKFESFNKAGETENVYNVTPDPSKASILVISQVGDHRIQVTITLTSKAMREEGPVAEGTGGDGENAAAPVNQGTTAASEAGVLDRGPCLAALAALRHTTWFKTAAAMLPSCTIVLRVLKDICHRVPAWGVLDSWMIELLVPKCIISANPDYTKPGDVFRRVIECVASGLFLPGGSGLCDPCETGVVDASAKLTAQERANITLSAQHALRLIAFSKLHLVLGVDPLPPPGQARRLKRQQQQQQQQQQEQEAAESAESGAATAGAREEESGAMVGGGEDGGQGEEGDGAANQTAGVKREPPSKDQEESEAVKKIKLES